MNLVFVFDPLLNRKFFAYTSLSIVFSLEKRADITLKAIYEIG
jgi:hypothetical protein